MTTGTVLSMAETTARIDPADPRYIFVGSKRLLRIRGGDETLTNEKLGEQIETLTAKANDMVQQLGDSPSPEDVKAVQDEMQTLQSSVQPLLEERERRLTMESVKALKGRVTTLNEVYEELREAAKMPEFPELGGKTRENDGHYFNGETSFYKNLALAARGGRSGAAAQEALEAAVGGKAMTEGTETAGGYLVNPERLGTLQEPQRGTPLLDLIPQVKVNTDSIEFVSITSGLVAGWVAELAAKPSGDFTFGQVSASVFTAAGLAVVSNQLLEDSSIDSLITTDLVKRVRNVVEIGILSGSGTGQPRGILNTTGIQTETYTDASPTVGELLVAIGNGVAKVVDNHLSEPTHIIMRPQTWTKIITDASAAGLYTLGSGVSDPGQRSAVNSFPGRSLFGYPVVLTGNMPSNLGAGTNETRVVIADLSEQLLLNRSEFSVDRSEHVYFTSNQTVFRGERRVGFTAARYPKSICVVQGTGLINTFA